MFRHSYFCREDKFDREIAKMKKEYHNMNNMILSLTKEEINQLRREEDKKNNINKRRFFIPYTLY